MNLEQLAFISAAGLIGLLLGLLVSYLLSAQKKKALEAQLAVCNHELMTKTQHCDDLKEQLVVATTDHQQLKVQAAQQETKLNLLTIAHSELTQSSDELKHRLDAINLELTQCKQSLSTALAQLEAQIHKVEATQAALTQAQATLNSTSAQLTQEKDKNASLEKQLKGMEVSVTETQKAQQKIAQTYDELKAQYDQLHIQHNQLTARHAELKTSLEERDISHKEKVAQLEENKMALTKEFENLANKIFEEKGKTFTHTSKESIDIMLQPFKAQIEGFQKRINEVHDASTQGNAHLNAEIKKVLEIGLKMSAEATNLTSALKGDSQKRGAWGEAQLERTLEMSGLVQGAHYEKQTAFKDSDGKRKNTDYIIKLPDDKHIIIDSKVSLVAYDRTISAKTDEEYNLALAEHTKAVKNHIDELSSKDYTNLIGMRSPSFVLMFMPIEPAYIEALKNSKDLFGYGYDKGIVLVSHTTLIPILRTVANLWVMEQSNKEAREISDRAGEIYNNVCTLTERLARLGHTMNTASNHYNDTVKALVGQQGLHGKVERFTQLSSKVSKTLTPIEPRHLDFETEKLQLLAEPIEESNNPD